ncbi:hypothetical protein IT774_14490 [Salinimonas marina]|uniref:Potassium channel domain-containing protein n=1 Tax=Salinimonas marina TaxID=2785918 RepID=A0A7S9DWQ8_9ALTE|nr:ion channel [Salinimonas marina]QPG05303.1 hypothetical protein IT774_14490 [Salinimonas marina]
MLPMFFITLVTLMLALTLHYINLTWLVDTLCHRTRRRYWRMQFVMLAAAVNQVSIAGLFCLTYVAGIELNLGQFKDGGDLKDIFYFSLTTITTLGLGSTEPSGDLKMVAGLQSALGFLLITCTGSKLYSHMSGKFDADNQGT